VATYNDAGVNADGHPCAIVADGDDRTYVTGRSFGDEDDYLTIAYDAEGHELWRARYEGAVPRSMERSKGLAVDSNHGVYVTGESGQVPSMDIATIKYDGRTGAQLWAARYSSAGDKSHDMGKAIAVDARGGVYVSGVSTDAAQRDHDIVTVKYASTGAELWSARFDAPGVADSPDLPVGLAVDDAGNAYVVGQTGAAPDEDYLVLKYDTDGIEVWRRTWDGPRHGPDLGRAIAVDDAGNVYVTGTTVDDPGHGEDYLTLKYDPEGSLLWASAYNDERFDGDDVPSRRGLAVDAEGGVYVTGSCQTALGWDHVTLKYDAAGHEVWASRSQGAGEPAAQLVLDDDGDVYVAGNGGSEPANDFLTIAYDRVHGVERWAVLYSGPAGDSTDTATSMALDGHGGVYVTGMSDRARPGSHDLDYVTVKYQRDLPASGREGALPTPSEPPG
jgi:hypothetical protein